MACSTVLLLDYLSCALLGGAAAFRGARHSLPFTGALILGAACALISPLLRTIMLFITTQVVLQPNALDGRGYVAASFAGACAGYLLQRRTPEEAPVFQVLEGASLALATVLGTYAALAIGPAPSPVGSVIIGCMAGTVGGMLRDLCLIERPALLEADFYGSAVVVGAMAVTGLHASHADFRLQMALGGFCVFGLRLLGAWRMKRLGRFSEF